MVESHNPTTHQSQLSLMEYRDLKTRIQGPKRTVNTQFRDSEFAKEQLRNLKITAQFSTGSMLTFQHDSDFNLFLPYRKW